MGFFDNSQTTSGSQSMASYNQALDTYSNSYRATAPWSFATLDPTATLAAMGKSKTGTSVGGKNLGADFKASLKGMSADEKAQAQQTNQALQRIQQRQESGQFLTPQETDFINQSLDKAFEYANTTGMRDITLQSQALAGRQGLRTSDTPIATTAMNATRDLALGLGSQRAQQGLNATMNMGMAQNEFDKSFAEFNQNLQLSRTNSRLGFLFSGGLQGASSIDPTSTLNYTNTTVGSPSAFQDMTSSFSFAKDLSSSIGGAMGGGGMGKMFSGFGGAKPA